MELEFAVDPLFKKASADFDEGGAKGLLLNHLAIDGNGRIVFDSSDDSQDATDSERRENGNQDEFDAEVVAERGPETEQQATEIDIDGLAARFFPDLSILDNQDICPSLKAFELGDASGSLDLPFLKAPEDWKQDGKDTRNDSQSDKPTMLLEDANAGAFDDDDNMLGGMDLLDDIGFGEGGEAWAKDAALVPQMRVHGLAMEGVEADGEDGTGDVGGFEPDNPKYTVTIRHGKEEEQENILNYFDKALQKNWAGPEHWKIRRVKDAAKAANAGPVKRKEKEPFEIDFAAPMSQALADALYTPAPSASSISLPKAQWKSKGRNLLPDDKHFSSRQLLRLFLKPKASIGTRKQGGSMQQNRLQEMPEGEVDEQYWARKEEAAQQALEEDGAQGNYDANFFQDDGFGGAADMDDDDEFADARDHLSPPLEDIAAGEGLADGAPAATQEGPFGTQLVTQSRRMRPEYVQYARVAKKVDVRRLKEEIWRGLALEDVSSNDDHRGRYANADSKQTKMAEAEPVKNSADETLMFTDVINGLQTVYPKQAMADISTSYCFICLLHLANEKGLVITNHENFQDLTIRKDYTAEIVSSGD
jgi:condensin complex subunit 2